MPAHRSRRLAIAATLACAALVTGPPTMTPAPGASVTTAATRDAAVTFLFIPRLHKRLRVQEGVSQKVLARGVGHYPRTAPPGGLGNVVLLGHRVTHTRPFRHIDSLRPGDALVLSVGPRRRTYRVYESRIISPKRRSVLAPVPFRPHASPLTSTLTLITCHPPGSRRKRLVVLARTADRN